MRNIYKHLHSEVVFIFQCIYTDKLNYVALALPRQVLSYDPPNSNRGVSHPQHQEL